MNSNLVQAHVTAGVPDNHYNIYEKKVDKLAARINDLDADLKLFISTIIDMHSLKQSILHSEENLKHTLQLIYNKI